ncbi:LacI family DNA-binding transcriptional regulator [Rhabdobacter roseus]|uniref:DNA-binding LacI/PurR family transcriptional regulator n=1 Tax=Rhabdobacter roseus TaxID=1655419 RepID=A0A840TVR7_9BACT|nr:LacI family DNA-binding transcriptional regulator [Rhabdobacter roseus]MBB5284050.1 DNA-binding LacI/PurR family transcriptional regulator [Rhabdobacter roseus]
MPRLARNRRTSVTIYDIAEKLSISASTVSRALRGHPDIRQETIEAVKAMAKKLNYQPNTMAQNLRERRTKMIGLVLPEIQSSFYASVLNGIEEVAFQKGYQVMVCKSGENYQRELVQVYALSNLVDGMLVCLSEQTQKTDHFRHLKQQGTPCVFFDRAPENVAGHRVLFEDEALGFALTENLIKAGFRHIAHLTGPNYLKACKDRLAGYQKALQQYGLPDQPELVLSVGFGYQDGRLGFQKLMKLSPRPDAIFAGSDPIATAVVVEARRAGISIPQELGLATFGSDPMHTLLDPPVTGLNPKGFEMGSTAAQLCIQEIEKTGKSTRYKTEYLKCDIAVRRSSVKLSGDEQLIASYSRYLKSDTHGDELVYIY